MKKNIIISFLFMLYYVIIMMSYCKLNDFKYLNIVDIYNNPSIFIIVLFYINILISIKLENKLNKNNLMIIVMESLKLSSIIMNINILIPLLFNINYNIFDIINMTFHLFFIMVIVYSYINLLFEIKGVNNTKYICLSIFCLIYFFEYIYNYNSLVIPLYKNYIHGNSFINSILIYILWLIIPIFILLRRRCKNNVTVKKG